MNVMVQFSNKCVVIFLALLFFLAIYMKSYTCVVVLNITNGFGNFVLSSILDANVPKQINDQLGVFGQVNTSDYTWDSGIASHDLYLTYKIDIHNNRLLRNQAGPWIARLLYFTFLQSYILRNELEKRIAEGFKSEINGNEAFVILKSCNVA